MSEAARERVILRPDDPPELRRALIEQAAAETMDERIAMRAIATGKQKAVDIIDTELGALGLLPTDPQLLRALDSAAALADVILDPENAAEARLFRATLVRRVHELGSHDAAGRVDRAIAKARRTYGDEAPGERRGVPPPSDGDAPCDAEPNGRARMPESPASIAERWATAGQLRRISSGITPLDDLCRGGFSVPRRVALVGAPGAGKTFVLTCIADHMARAEDGPCVGVLGVDEDTDDLCVRLSQRAGYTSADLDQRNAETMRALASSLAPLRLRFYSSNWTIDEAGADIAAWAKAENRPGALFIDSIQTVASAASEALERRDPRHIVEANASAVRALSDQHAMLVVYTSEANRSAYRNGSKGEQLDIAAGAESRAIEFGAQTLLVLRTPAAHDDIVHVTVPKNRRERRSRDGFFLQLDRERHALSECDAPAEGEATAKDKDAAVTANKRAKVERDARELLRLVLDQPGESTRRVRERAQGKLGWGKDRVSAACALLESGTPAGRLVNRGSQQRSAWYAEAGQQERLCKDD